MDFGDSPDEAGFRDRLRAWLVDNNPGLPTSSTDDGYWAGMAAWHRSLHQAGFFGLSWPEEIGGQGLSSVYDVILDDELAAAGAPPRPSLGYLVHGILAHASEEVAGRFLPGIISGDERWCQGFSEPDAGSDLAALSTRAERDGDDYVLTGHKVWTSYSDEADWCLVLARTDPDVPKHKGISAFAISMRQPGIEQRPLKMINGVTKEFGEVIFDGARVPAANMIGEPGAGWGLAMTVVSHEREPGELGYVSRYRKLVRQLADKVREQPAAYTADDRTELAWAMVEADMLRHHVCRRLSSRLDGIDHGPDGSVDKLLMTQVEQAVGHASLAIGGTGSDGGEDTWLKVYLYSRAQSVMGGTSQIQRNLIASRLLGLPPLTYDLPPELLVEADGAVRIVRLNRPDDLNATNHDLHEALAALWPQIEADADVRAVVLTGNGRAFSAGGDFDYLDALTKDEELRNQTLVAGRRIVTGMVGCTVPVIAAVNGPAVGLGCSLVALSDVVFMAESAHLADPHVAIGLVAADGGPVTWPLLTSLQLAKEYAFTGDRIPAARAAEIGLVNHVVPDGEALERALAYAHRVAKLPRQALRDTKRILNMQLERAVLGCLDFALSAENTSFTSPELRANLDRMRAK